jgi:pyrimidine-nucleoside phosphorylase
MRTSDLILAKREGQAHSREELFDFVFDYVHGLIPDYQVSAWLMAVCWRGMTPSETSALTEAMAASGQCLNLDEFSHAVDKHSTGGVGDKTTLVLAPLLAACGATVAKMSGRGLGHTGGTIDKLKSIPGFRSNLSKATFLHQARSVGVVITGQSKSLAPADRLMYALRDVTATVQSLPLIASSIMSKKLAGGAKSIVLDVKVGSGTFIKTISEATTLARTMIAIGENAGRRMRALLTDMAEPLGLAIGNAIEVREAVACLQGKGPPQLRNLCLALATQLLAASGLDMSEEKVAQTLDGGAAHERFERWIAAQGGNPSGVADLGLAPDQVLIRAQEQGVLSRLDAFALGRAINLLGGGRSAKTDPIDLGVGALLHAKVGDPVSVGEPVMTIYHRGGHHLEEATKYIQSAIKIADSGAPRKTVLKVIGS